jgi:hypothetical protein
MTETKTADSEKQHLKKQLKDRRREEKKKLKRKKKNALIVCHSGKEFWTTQDQFWQWMRERIIVKTGDNPLRGNFIRKDDEYAVVISNTLLNLAHPNHLREALYSRKYASR